MSIDKIEYWWPLKWLAKINSSVSKTINSRHSRWPFPIFRDTIRDMVTLFTKHLYFLQRESYNEKVCDITHRFCAKVILYFCTAVISIFSAPYILLTKTDSEDPRQSKGLHCEILSAKSGKITKDDQERKIN